MAISEVMKLASQLIHPYDCRIFIVFQFGSFISSFDFFIVFQFGSYLSKRKTFVIFQENIQYEIIQTNNNFFTFSTNLRYFFNVKKLQLERK